MVALENSTVALQNNSSPPAPKAHVKATQKPVPVKKTQAKPKLDNTKAASEQFRKATIKNIQVKQAKLEREQENISKEMLVEAAQRLKHLAEYISDNTHLIARDYRVHEQTNRVTVKVYDSVTGEIVREIPGKDFLDRIARMEELLGVMFDNLV